MIKASLPFFHGINLAYSAGALLPARIAGRQFTDALGEGARLVRNHFSKAVTGQTEQILGVWSKNLRQGEGALGNTAVNISGGDLIQEFIQTSGVRIGRVSADVGFNQMQRLLNKIGETVTPLKSPLTKARHLNDLVDKGLWNIVKDGMSMSSWVHVRESMFRELINKEGVDALKDATKVLRVNQEAGAIVNQAFGGILDRLMLQPNMRRFARNALLAPDWTASNMFMARDLFANMLGAGAVGRRLSRDILLRDARFRFALGYQARAAFYWFTLEAAPAEPEPVLTR